MPLEALRYALGRIARSRRIVGVDVCGEYSPPRFDGLVKRIAAWLDHPDAKPRDGAAGERNGRTNEALIRTLAEALG